MNIDSIRKVALKPVITGAVNSQVLPIIQGAKRAKFMGKDISIGLFGFLVGAGSDFAVELVTQYVLPEMNTNKKLQHLSSMVLTLGGSGIAQAIATSYLTGGTADSSQLQKSFASGVLSQLVSQYVYENFIQDTDERV